MYNHKIDEIYENYIKVLSPEEKIELINTIQKKLSTEKKSIKKTSIMALHGLGKEIWNGVDAQVYVNNLRDEWDGRP